jgi:DNA-binding transcriptional LysR family regulator
MQQAAPDVSLRLEIGFEPDIMQGLIEGTVDIGVMYTPTTRSGLEVELLFDETLMLVTTDLKRDWPDDGYIHIDWGPEFHVQFSDHFPDVPPPALVANIGWLGVQQLLTYGGSGYFPKRLVRQYIETGQLWRMPDAPQFTLPTYMVFPRDSDHATLKLALDGLRELARAELELDS